MQIIVFHTQLRKGHDFRGEMDVKPTDDQGQVIQTARERCREFLRSGTSLGFNATNILKRTRRPWIDLFAAYKARIELVYIEPTLDHLFQRNKRRRNSVPEQVIRRLATKCEPPTWADSHGLIVTEGG
jgi:predicted kinase